MPPPSPPLLILIVPTIAFFLWLIANPSFLSSTTTTTTHRVRPGSVHKVWDSLNIFLVLFAILCGVFAPKNDDDSSDNSNSTTGSRTGDLNYKPLEEDQKRTVSNPPSWFDQFSNDRTFAAPRLKRSSSSYPDLRQESWENHLDDDQRFRFFDDFEISSKLYTSSPSSEILHRRNRSRSFEESNVKEIPVDTFVLRSSSSLRSPSPPPLSKSPSPAPTPPPPPPPPPRRRVYKTVPRKEKLQRPTEPPTPPPPPPQPPPRPPPSPPQEKKYVKSERKRTNASKEIKMVLASLYNQRKRKKKQRSMKKNTCDDVSASLRSPNTETTSNTRPRPSQPPPPPPPPPPPSMFHSLFRKGSKSKKIHSFSAPPPPPPPPPSSRKLSKRKTPVPHPPAPPTPPRRYSTSTGRPPLPTRANNFYDDNVNSGGQSPLIPMPPPPPPPPFKVQGFRFVVTGDFVKIRSASSSRCGSPEREEVENDVTASPGGVGGGASVFCPSPDVNSKADSFIARLRDEWRLEKMNSWKEKSVSRSPSAGPI